MARLILASSSPRRRELLQQLGLEFEIYSPDIDESILDGEDVAAYVECAAPVPDNSLLLIKFVLLNIFVNIQVKFVQPNGKKELKHLLLA